VAAGEPGREGARRVGERIRWRRTNFTQQQSRCLVAVEDLSVGNMVRNPGLAKSLHDAAWTQFAAVLRYNAAWAGREYVAEDPKHTSQTCSRCGWSNLALTLDDCVFHCLNPARPDYRLVLDRDRNAALNILAWGKAVVKALG